MKTINNNSSCRQSNRRWRDLTNTWTWFDEKSCSSTYHSRQRNTAVLRLIHSRWFLKYCCLASLNFIFLAKALNWIFVKLQQIKFRYSVIHIMNQVNLFTCYEYSRHYFEFKSAVDFLVYSWKFLNMYLHGVIAAAMNGSVLPESVTYHKSCNFREKSVTRF